KKLWKISDEVNSKSLRLTGFALVNDQWVSKAQAAYVTPEAPNDQEATYGAQLSTYGAQPDALANLPTPSSPHEHFHFNLQEAFDSLNNRINTLQLELQQLQLENVEHFETLQAQIQSSPNFQAQ
ncbi:hypothetical protein PanWU01x14_095370, partial [Parasponia andersonii]